MAASLVSNVGTTTSVASSGGMPPASSSLGSRRGPTRSATVRFTNVIAKSLAGIRPSSARKTSATPPAPLAANGMASASAVTSAIDPRYPGSPQRTYARRTRCLSGAR